jgi:hypothetical protein
MPQRRAGSCRARASYLELICTLAPAVCERPVLVSKPQPFGHPSAVGSVLELRYTEILAGSTAEVHGASPDAALRCSVTVAGHLGGPGPTWPPNPW